MNARDGLKAGAAIKVALHRRPLIERPELEVIVVVEK
jgi:hypothetical protein